jgi:2-dehydro-3-deoxygluconokinase
VPFIVAAVGICLYSHRSRPEQKEMRIVKTDAAFVAFGELLLRFAAPGAEVLLQTPVLNVCVGGAEANVAASMAQFGHATRYVSVVADNALGRAARDELRRHGVDCTGVIFAEGRMGVYFLTPGAIRRAPEILYDRADSTFAAAPADAVDWAPRLAGAGWFHVSGVTAAVGPAASEAAVRAAEAAKGAGLTVSFDCNYRAKLWDLWHGDGPAILRRLLACADVLFGDHRDIALILGKPFAGEADDQRRAAAQAVFAAFPNIQRMACTHRVQHSVDHHDLSGFLFSPDAAWSTQTIALTPIVDRIGGGDAFAAGVIHGLKRGWDDQRALDFGVAAGGYKHAIPGDFNLAREADILSAMCADGLDVRR